MRFQRPVKGGRAKLGAAVEHAIEREVRRLARKFECSRSFVIKVALADQFGIEMDDRYDVPKEQQR